MKKPVSKIWLPILFVLLVMVSITAIAVFRANVVRAATPDAGVYWTCTPNLVVSANVRVVVRCTAGYVIDPNTTIYWFAYPTKDSASASRMLSVFETAKATDATVTLYFDTTDYSGSSYGCQITDCRAIWAVTTP